MTGMDNGVVDKLDVDIKPDHTASSPTRASNGVSNGKAAPPKVENSLDSDSDEDDVPLAQRFKTSAPSPKTSPNKRRSSQSVKEESDSDDEPLSNRVKDKPSSKKSRPSYKEESDSDESEDDYKPAVKKSKTSTKKVVKPSPKSIKPSSKSSKPSTSPRKKKADDEAPKWEWWKEKKRTDGTRWSFLQHSGPLFAPVYEPLPLNVHFRYNGEKMHLSEAAEEVCGFYARMIDHDYTKNNIFNENFMKDWRKVMTSEERDRVTKLAKCDFKAIDAYYKKKSQERKEMTKEQKLVLKNERAAEMDAYGMATCDGHDQKIANFRIEPPGLFRGRGEHPKMGKLKKRIRPEDVIINCSRDAKTPSAPAGHRWKEVRHDNTVTWMASWTENVQGQNKYVMFNPSSKIKGEKDMSKFDMARRLHENVDSIRGRYAEDLKSKTMMVRQRAVALYFIDKLALRAGNEKDSEDQAETFGCCSLKVGHVTLHEQLNDKANVVVFDFLGKDSIRYHQEVPVEKRVYKNLKIFKENKKDNDDLFDRVDTSTLNTHLQSEMKGLTAKVFRTYNASITLMRCLDNTTKDSMTVPEKVLTYNRANREVAVLCNHQRAAPKTFDKSMENMKMKEKEIKGKLKEIKKNMDSSRGGDREKMNKQMKTKKEQLARHRLQMQDKEENKEISLGTSKLNYLDPRISVAWCLKYDVPLEKVYSKTHREKFQWAIDMTEEDWRFDDASTIMDR